MSRIAQCTVSGKDSGGYAWQNVFHVKTENDDAAEKDVLAELVDIIWTTISGPFLDAMTSENSVLDFAAKLIGAAASYTFHKVLLEFGTRDENQAVGSLAGKLAWYPKTGAYVGHQYVPGCAQQDFDNDIITDAYKTLLDALGTAFMSIDGTLGVYNWQFVIYNRKAQAGIDVAAFATLQSPTTLSKRIKA